MFPKAETKALHSKARCSLPSTRLHPSARLRCSFTSASVSFFAGISRFSRASRERLDHYAAYVQRQQGMLRVRLPLRKGRGLRQKTRYFASRQASSLSAGCNPERFSKNINERADATVAHGQCDVGDRISFR